MWQRRGLAHRVPVVWLLQRPASADDGRKVDSLKALHRKSSNRYIDAGSLVWNLDLPPSFLVLQLAAKTRKVSH
jgi:hypothetical protein